ncbi:MAG: TolC family protein [Magnetococcales bacterium]|nr:TolC family protein [Magnetococcales bacterium]
MSIPLSISWSTAQRSILRPVCQGACALVLLAGCSLTVPAISREEQARLAERDRGELFAGQQALSGPLTLHEAMARAIRYNLDLRLKRMEEALAKGQEDVAGIDMLPRLTLAAGYSDRSPDTSSVSRSMVTGQVSSEPTVSRNSTSITGDLTMSWNLLDFGMSYFQSRQEGNKALVQGEYRRKALHNLLKDVRFAYWKAAAAQWLEREVAVILKSSDEALAIARKVESENLRSPVHALQFQLGLLEIVRQLEKSRADLAIAKEELAVLINLEPGVVYQLADDAAAMERLPEMGVPVTELESLALSSRPELRIEHYQARIEADETRKAIARLFPGLEFAVSENYDDNAFLVYQHWAQAGARLSWNLLRVLTRGSQMDLAARRENVVQIRRLVLHMAVVSQVRIAWHEYRAARETMQRLRTEGDTRRRLQEHTANRGELGMDSQLSYVHNVAAAALGRVQQYEAFARYQSALGRLFASIGLDPMGEWEPAKENVLHLTRRLRENDTLWGERFFRSVAPNRLVNPASVAPLPLEELVSVPGKETQPPASGEVAREPVPASQESPKVAPKATEEPPSAQPEEKPKVPPPLPIAPSAPEAVFRYAVQVAATMDGAAVDPLIAHLRSKGYHPVVNQVSGPDGQHYQIWIGRYSGNSEAEMAREAFQRQEGQPAFVRPIGRRQSH